jgi:hypothetical protein
VTRKTTPKRRIKRGRKRIRRILQTNVSRRKMKNDNACLPRTVNCIERSITIASTIGASTIWSEAITRRKNVVWAKNAQKSKMKDATSMQPQLPPPPLANLSGATSWPAFTATCWLMNDSSDWHGDGGPPMVTVHGQGNHQIPDNGHLPMSSSRFSPSFFHGSGLS